MSELDQNEVSPEVARIQANASWESLTAGADQVPGGELETAASLVGFPFVILRLIFRVGDFGRTDEKYKGEPGDYVSAELITAPAEIVSRRREKGKIPATSTADPGAALVLNLSGTGAYRQIVEYLEAKTLIKLPEGPSGGEFGKSRLDTPVREWEIVRDPRLAIITLDPDGKYKSAQFDVQLHAPRGLRVSEFDNDYAKGNEVYYLA